MKHEVKSAPHFSRHFYQLITLAVLLTSMALVFTACGNTNDSSTTTSTADTTVPKTETPAPSTENNSEVNSEVSATTESAAPAPQESEAALPEGIKSIPAETQKNTKLENAIMTYANISTDDANTYASQYLYNYVDLNGDGQDEILALVMGMLTSGTGGSTLYHVLVSGDTMTVIDAIPIVSLPIIVSDSKTSGVNDLLITNYDLSPSGFVKLTHGEAYQNPNDGEALASLDGYTGTRIMDTDIDASRADGTALYLADGKPAE